MCHKKNKENRFFLFLTKEKRGIFILLGVLLLIIFINISIPYFLSGEKCDFESFKADILNFEQGRIQEEEQHVDFDFISPNSAAGIKETSLFPFDPNKMDNELGKKLGLSSRQVLVIMNYLNKGGVFRKKEDFKRMYSISEKTYQTLEPYLDIPESKELNIHEKSKTFLAESKPELFIIELNTADTLDLKELKGIGSVFSNRIVNYRNRLGGFISMKQLLEIKGFSQELLDRIEKQIIVDEMQVRKININTASVDEMKNHPYMDYYLAKAVFLYRQEHQKFRTVDELLRINLMTPEVFTRVKPYLSIE